LKTIRCKVLCLRVSKEAENYIFGGSSSSISSFISHLKMVWC
jgi:hypothetical protein